MEYLSFLPYVLTVVGIVMGYMRMRPAMLAWGACAIGVIGGAIVAIVFIVTGYSWVYVFFAALPAALAALMTIKDLSYPRINDVATDVDNPVQFAKAIDLASNRGRDMAYPEAFAPLVRQHYPDVKPLFAKYAVGEVFEIAEALATKQKGWKVTHRDPDNGLIEAVATTSFLCYSDDVIVAVSEQESQSRIDMRSKSREGLVDAGKNANRIRSFLDQLKTALAS